MYRESMYYVRLFGLSVLSAVCVILREFLLSN